MKLKIKRKNFPTKFKDYKIDWFNTDEHNIFQRIKERSSITKASEFISVMEKVFIFLIDNIQEKTHLGITLEKSKFKVGLIINPKEKYIRVNTVLDYNMKLYDRAQYTLDEFKINFFNIIEDGYYVFEDFKSFQKNTVLESVKDSYYMKEYDAVFILEMIELSLKY